MCDILDLNRDDCDEAIRTFKAYIDRAGLCKTDEAASLAVSALAIAQKSSGRSTEMKELADASGVAVKEIEAVCMRIFAHIYVYVSWQAASRHRDPFQG